MDKSKEIVIVENGHLRSCNGARKCNGSSNGNLTKETMVQLSGTVRNTGCYLSRFQVVIFLFANLLTVAVAIVLVTFVKKEPVIFVTKPNALCGCNLMSGTTVNASLAVKQTLNTTLSIKNQTENETESYENTTNFLKPTTPLMSFPWDDIRLPRDLIPVHYDLDMRIDLEQTSYVGAVNMTVTAVNPTKFVVFHFYWIYITGSSIKVRNKMTGNTVKIIKQRNVWTRQFRVIELESELEAGIVYVVEVGRYNGTITGDLKGLYLSTYETASGETRRLAATQLQSTDARRMFPCFDEPDMKATFSLTITHQSEYKALSNMPEECVQWLEGGWEKCTFQKTPIMSTYLLAVIVSDFEKKEKILDDGYELRVWAQPNKINQTDYALGIAEDCYTYFSEYFGIVDVVPKADHVAVPDFSAGAMENWGLVIYRETSLLYDDEVSSSSNKLMVTLIVAHEVAHTWFGNMVTMKWWDDLWLNEGFASLLMYFAMDHICPDWDVFTLHVVVKEVFVVMLKDALLSSHPVSSPIRSPDDIAQFFDAISYQKGMSVLRMLLGFVGKDDFQAGLRLYINRFKFQNAEMDELWETFSEAVDHRFDIKSIMNTWTRQMGYPVVTMETKGDYYVLEQERFLLDGNSSDGESSIYEYMWQIPFTYKTEDDASPTESMVWLNMTSATIPRTKDKWILANIDYIGFYRVNYELSMWGKLAEQLNTDHTVFPEANRGGLIGDSFNLARAKLLPYDVALNMTTYLKQEVRYVPWKAFLDSLEYIRASMSKTGTYVLLQKYLHDLVKPAYEKMGTNTDCSLPEKYLRQLILTTACDVGVKSAVDFAKDLFRKWKEDDEPVPSDYSAIVYSIGVREGSVEEWDFVWNKSMSSNVAGEREMLMEALAQSQKPWLLWRYANWIFDPTKIKMQDVRLVVSFFAKTPLGRMIALHLLQNKWDKLNEQFGYDTFLLRETIAEVTQYVNSDFEYTQLATLFKNKPAKIAQKETENALTLIRANIKWMKENYNNITTWLRNHVVGML